MIQLVARAAPGRLLFRTHHEARALWGRLLTAFPEAAGLVLMPNHLHLDLPSGPGRRLGDVMSGYARWRNAHRGERGDVWEAHPPPRVPADEAHARRLLRYTLLNPCRARLTADPLAWPWSLHRDLVGFGDARPAVREPARLHAWVSADATVCVEGTPLPVTRFDAFDWGDVLEAACGVARMPRDAVTTHRGCRSLAIRTAWVHGLRDAGRLAAWTGASRRRVYELVAGLPSRGARLADPLLDAAVRAVGDERFTALDPRDLRPRWAHTRYARLN